MRLPAVLAMQPHSQAPLHSFFLGWGPGNEATSSACNAASFPGSTPQLLSGVGAREIMRLLAVQELLQLCCHKHSQPECTNKQQQYMTKVVPKKHQHSLTD